MKRKIDAMYEKYGKHENENCRSCVNYRDIVYHGRIYRKCAAYGVTSSEASDWRASDIACGRYGKRFDEDKESPLFEILKHQRGQKEDVLTPCEGQLGMNELLEVKE